jgi:cyclic-di-AMP phosphodiesterase PgpH
MLWTSKPTARRRVVRDKAAHVSRARWRQMEASGVVGSLAIALGFFLVASAILMLREQVVPYRPQQFIPSDIYSRVDFVFPNEDLLAAKKDEAAREAQRIYRQNTGGAASAGAWNNIESYLLSLPDLVANSDLDELKPPLRDILDSGALTALQQDVVGEERGHYNEKVRAFVDDLKNNLSIDNAPLVILPKDQRLQDAGSKITLINASGTEQTDVDVDTQTYSANSPEYVSNLPPEVIAKLDHSAKIFELMLAPKIAPLTAVLLGEHPTHTLDSNATAETVRKAADAVPTEEGNETFVRGEVLAPAGILSDQRWEILRAENSAYLRTLDAGRWKQRTGAMLVALVLSAALGAYTYRYQPRIVRNHTRGIALASMLLAMLLITELAGLGSSSFYFFGIAPTILGAIILTIAYDQRFAIGVGSIHAMFVTSALDQNLNFFLIVWVGVAVSCYLLHDIRTRSKLIEIGGLTALAMVFVTAAVGAIDLDPIRFISQDCLYVAAAGLTAGFIALGILPFIEKAFKITTSMTLLELADASQPLLRRLAMEAPGTYNHSLQVATLSEAAAEMIGVNSLACRVGAYYHDIGKINKADYFVENQLGGGPSRHINLSPSVSLLIIIGHVKDGIELAKEYTLPNSLLPYIQQHHGTTLVEYFYHQACLRQEEAQPAISDTQYRYPGPKPKTKETAILMLADCAESACRAMVEPNASRIETLVHDLAMKRLHDGQFDECDLTMRDLELVERAMVKTLLGIYHGRIAYPSTSQPAPQPASQTQPSIKLA